MKRFPFLFLIGLIFFSSCSVKKRSYMKGYYVNWVFAKKKSEPILHAANKNSTAKKETQIESETVVSQPKPEEDVYVSSDEKKLNISLQKKILHFLSLNADTCGDLIIFKNGDKVRAKVLVITETTISYKRCDNITGPMIDVSKNEVSTINYTSGYTDNFSLGTNPTHNKNKIFHPLTFAVITLTTLQFLCLMFAIIVPVLLYLSLFCGLISLFVALQAEKVITAQLDKYKGLAITKLCFIISTVFVAMLLLSLLFYYTRLR